MATYGSLLIGAGGGVIDHQKQSDKQPGATVIIGLGGTGSDAVIKLKKEVYKQLKPDDVTAVIPKYDNIKYLIIDSDAAKIRANKDKKRLFDIDESTEFFSISNNSIRATFGAKDILKGRRELDWLDYDHISIDDASAGAGGIRQVGRFLLVDKAAELYTKIRSVFTSALLGAEGKLTVHICTGISGGTGSGTFLDVCYLVREALREMGRAESNVCGYFFLPDVNLSVPAITANPLISGYISVNGFAALKELDYCMNFGKNKDSFKMNYGFKTINNAQKPVDLCYLVSTTNQAGDIVPDGYNYAMGVVTDYILNFLAKVQLPPGVSADNDTSGITLEGHISNLNTIRAGITLQHGAGVDYNVLGASVAEMPLSEIATYLGYKLFESYTGLYNRMPTEQERNDFLQNCQLKYEDIKKALTQGCPVRIDFPNRFDARMFKENGNGKFVEFADAYLAKNKGVLEQNARTFLEEVDEFIIPGNSTSLVGRTYKGLCDKYVTQLDYGPFFAQRILYGTQNQNLIHAVDGFIAENQKLLEAEIRQDSLRSEDYDNALDRMRKANLLNQNGRISDYLNALNNLYVHHYNIEALQTMDRVLRGYKKHLISLNNSFFDVLTTVMDTLSKTFEDNGNVLSQGVKTSNTYSWKILSVPDIKATLDNEVKNLDLQQTLDGLMQTLMDNCEKWINQDPEEIAKLISDFVLKTFGEAAQKTITDYLSVKFGVPKANIALLAQKIETEIIRAELDVKSSPLFWKNHMYHGSVGMNSTLTVPYNSAEIKVAAETYVEGQTQFVVRESGITDKISMMRFYSGLPMYAYQAILELQDKYEADKKPGRHLYERGDVNWNEWLPSPVPASFKVGIPVPRIEERNKKLLEEFEQAEKFGVVKKNETLGYWEIQKTADFDADAYIQKQGGYVTPDGRIDLNKVEAIKNGLGVEKQTLIANANPVRIECGNANVGSEEQVMLDFYLASPILNNLLRQELEKIEAINNKIEELEKIKIGVGSKVTEKKNFFNAIFTGVLSYGNTIVYAYEEFGMEKSVVLQNQEMEYGDTGAYQAYLNYESLNETIKAKIVKETKLRMNEEDNPSVKEAVEKLEAGMPKKIARYNLLHDETDPIHADLQQFYNEFMRAFSAFKLMV